MKRPKGVTAIAWIIIVWYGLGFVNTLLYMKSRTQWFPGTSILWMVMLGIALISGIAILRGLSWGRILYLLIAPIIIAFNCLSQWVLYGFHSTFIPWFIVAKIILPAIFYTAALISQPTGIPPRIKGDTPWLGEKLKPLSSQMVTLITTWGSGKQVRKETAL